MNDRGSEVNQDRVRIAGREISRRGFLAGLSVTLGALGTLLVGVPVVGFLLNPLLKRVTDEWRAVGNVDDFSVGETTSVVLEDASPLPWAGVTARTAAWLRRDSSDKFTAFSVNCTHLGCPVRWLDDAHLFMCPCHGGVYYQDGSVAAGPPPRSLIEYPVRIHDGKVEIRTSPLPIT